jgi:hypothetical protein
MAHYAQIENGRVLNVVVVSRDDDVKEFPGEWVKTSYNTRAGVHYGPDGQSDGGEALRKNYAVVGGHYDVSLDAFYSPQPSPHHRLDTHTCVWVDTRSAEVLQAARAASFAPPPTPATSVYIPGSLMTEALAEVFASLQVRTGITVGNNFTKANSSILVSNDDLVLVLEDPLGRAAAPVTWEIYQKLFEETELEQYGLQVLTVEETQALAYPLAMMSVSVAVNEQGQAFFWDVSDGVRRCLGGECTERTKRDNLNPQVEQAIRDACLGLGMPAGLHTVNLVQRNSYWYLLEWQPLLDPVWLQECLKNPKALDTALRYMTGT